MQEYKVLVLEPKEIEESSVYQISQVYKMLQSIIFNSSFKSPDYDDVLKYRDYVYAILKERRKTMEQDLEEIKKLEIII